jgi:hypothetical protein
VAGCFGLGKFQNMFQIRNAHLTVGHNQLKDPDTRRVGACQKNLCTGFDVEVF